MRQSPRSEQISRRDGQQNPIILCDGHDIDFVTVTGQILMAVHKRSIPPGARAPRGVTRGMKRRGAPRHDGDQRQHAGHTTRRTPT